MTRGIVPQNNNEGAIGRAGLQWGLGAFQSLLQNGLPLIPFLPVAALTGGAGCLDGYTTVGLTMCTVLGVLVTKNGQLSLEFWALQAGTAAAGQVQPLDYDAANNQVYWTQVGGF